MEVRDTRAERKRVAMIKLGSLKVMTDECLLN